MATLHLFVLVAAGATAAKPSPTPEPPSMPLHPSLTVVAGILAAVFSLTFLLLLYFRHCKRRESSGTTPDLYSYSGWPRDSGVDRAVVESLPVFRFGALLGHKEGLECAVCLARFEAEEALRLLPKCRHAFHVECVDVWLDAHSSCPLCRARVHPEDVLLLPLAAPRPELTDKGRRSKGDVSVPSSGRRVSGRHSSAGEKSTKSLLRVVVDRADTRSRRSVDYAAAVGVDKERKDVLLPTAVAKDDNLERRFGHQIVVEGGDEGGRERWSDLRPSDLLLLKSEMIITDSGRFSASRVGGSLPVGVTSSEGSMSEITGVCRLPPPRWQREEESKRTMQRWLAFAATRTSRWLRGGSSSVPSTRTVGFVSTI